MNTIQALFDAGQITNDEMVGLSDIREDFVESLEKGASAVVEFIHEVFGECKEEELEKVSDMVEAIRTEMFASCDDPDKFVMADIASGVAMEKTAAGVGSSIESIANMTGVRPALQAAIAGTVGLHLLNTISQGISTINHPFQEARDRRNTAIQSEAALSSILKANPELKADKKTYENFTLLRKYAPQTVAVNKPLAETMLKKMQQWGGVDPQSLAQMIKMESDHMENIKMRSMIPESRPPSLPIKLETIGGL